MTAFGTAPSLERIPRLAAAAVVRRRAALSTDAKGTPHELEDSVMRMVDEWLYNEHRTRELTMAEETLLYLLFRQAVQPLTPALLTGCAAEFARVAKAIQ